MTPDRRTGRACAWIERADGRVAMTPASGGWTLPGGGIEPGETAQQAALREAWEETGARCAVAGEGWLLVGEKGTICVPLRLLTLEPSPEGLPVVWVNPRALPWAADEQLRQVLAAKGETPPHLALPPGVGRALALARAQDFPHSVSEETGRLLRTLAASKPGGHLLELGTGPGVGAAWLLAGMDPAARLLTAERDPERARQVADLLGDDARLRVHSGDWAEALAHGPFDLIFADAAPAKETAALGHLVSALKPGGLLLCDNLSPPARLPERWHGGDPLRDALFAHPGLSVSELGVSRHERVLLAVRG